MNATAEGLPTVSAFMFVRNGARSLRRAVDSLLSQTYPNIEFVIQDGASTDETLSILQSYGSRLQVVSAPDSGPNEGLWRALNRCTGNFVASCLSDEELLPDAIERAVAIFQQMPSLAAVTGDAIITDIDGVQTGFWKSGPFNLIDYLLCDYTPYFCASFFRRQALVDTGLGTATWSKDCIEFELWCRIAEHGRIHYSPQTFAKYASHPGQSTNNVRDVKVHFAGRMKQIAAICSAHGYFGESPLLRTQFVWGHARTFMSHFESTGRPDIAAALFEIARDALASFPPALIESQRYIDDASLMGAAPRKPSLKAALLAKFSSPKQQTTPQAYTLPPAIDPMIKARMNLDLARIYETEGRFEEALGASRTAAVLSGLQPLQSAPILLSKPGFTPVLKL